MALNVFNLNFGRTAKGVNYTKYPPTVDMWWNACGKEEGEDEHGSIVISSHHQERVLTVAICLECISMVKLLDEENEEGN